MLSGLNKLGFSIAKLDCKCETTSASLNNAVVVARSIKAPRFASVVAGAIEIPAFNQNGDR